MPRGRSRPLPTPEVPRTDAPASPAQAALLARDADEPQGRRFAIDEWHRREQRLLPGWCTLIERPLRGDDTAFIRRARSRHPALARAVHRRFAAWRPGGLQRVHGADDGDEIELDRAIEAAVDRRAGWVDDWPLYVRRDCALRDVATAFLVDTSASTDFVLRAARAVAAPAAAPSQEADTAFLYDLSASAPAVDAPRRRVIDVAKDALALMCDALHALGDAFAIYTFSGHGRSQVDFRVVKDFHERVSPRTAGALAAMQPHGATRTGAALRHASAMLARQPQRRRTLIVVTDGYPEDIDYGPEPRELRYGLEDTAHALREAQAIGIATFCLSIDPAGHDYLRRMCPPERYLVIGEVEALPEQLSKVYLAMTRPADG
jgi:nitric oxide reductase activation protein